MLFLQVQEFDDKTANDSLYILNNLIQDQKKQPEDIKIKMI